MTTRSTHRDRWTGVRRDLQHRRSRLIRSVRGRDDDVDAGSASLGETEHLVVYEQRQLDATLDALQRQELERIEAALARIADDTFGICAVCAVEIHPDRLEALPTATTCVACGDR